MPELTAVDLETAPSTKTTFPYALEPYRIRRHECEITSCSTFDTKRVSNQFINSSEEFDFDLEDMVSSWAGLTVYAHNAIFDVGYLYAHLSHHVGDDRAKELMQRVKWRDTAILYKYLINGQVAEEKRVSYSLKACIERTRKTIPEIADHPMIDEFLELKEADIPPGEDEAYWLKRGKLDSEFTLYLAEYLESKLTPDMAPGYVMACSAIWPLAEGWVHGILIDEEAVESYKNEAQKRQKEILESLNTTRWTPIEGGTLTSAKQLGNLLFNRMGFEPIMKTPKGAPSTNAESMLRLYQKHSDHPELALIMEYRKINTMLTKYVQGFEKAKDYLGYWAIHASPKILATVTGRMTYSSQIFKKYQVAIAQHQIPRKDKGIKRCMVPPKGYKVMYMDVSAQEGRVMAINAPESNMIHAYNEGLDLHSDLTEEIFGTPYLEIVQANHSGHPEEIVEQRQAGKLTGLSSFYRIGAPALARKFFSTYEYDISISTASQYLSAFKRKYPGVVRFWDKAIQMAKLNGYAEAWGGWRYRIKKFDWKGESNAINHPIQGSGAIQTYATIGVIKKRWPWCILVAQVHDAIIYFVPEDVAITTAKDIKERMDVFDYGALLGFKQTVPIILDVAVGDNFADLTDIGEYDGL